MNRGQPETDIPININELNIGERYTFYKQDGEVFRGTLNANWTWFIG